VIEPRTDFAALYSADYYRGRGADPLVDYEHEMADPATVRTYEWRGVTEVVRGVGAAPPGARWLDYGCGLGGLVRYARAEGFDAFGYDEGYAEDWLRRAGIPRVTAAGFEVLAGTFDVVTAIEVLEHTIDPITELRRIARLLRPGGVVFFTTGNAEPHRDRLTKWGYVHPDIHVSYFEPETLRRALEFAGLEPFSAGFAPGWTDIIRYKVLKQLRCKARSRWERALPWPLIAQALDRRLRLSAHPAGRRPV
jgi:SAM-dependent methyltransferase